MQKQELNKAFELLAQLEEVLAALAVNADITHFDLNCAAIRDELCELNEDEE